MLGDTLAGDFLTMYPDARRRVVRTGKEFQKMVWSDRPVGTPASRTDAQTQIALPSLPLSGGRARRGGRSGGEERGGSEGSQSRSDPVSVA